METTNMSTVSGTLVRSL